MVTLSGMEPKWWGLSPFSHRGEVKGKYYFLTPGKAAGSERMELGSCVSGPNYLWMCSPLFINTHPAVFCVCVHEHTWWETSDPSAVAVTRPELGPFPGSEEKKNSKNQTSPSFRRNGIKMYPASRAFSHNSASRDPLSSTGEKWPAENPGIMEKFVITHINHLFAPSWLPSSPRSLLTAPPWFKRTSDFFCSC